MSKGKGRLLQWSVATHNPSGSATLSNNKVTRTDVADVITQTGRSCNWPEL